MPIPAQIAELLQARERHLQKHLVKHYQTTFQDTLHSQKSQG